MNPSETLERVFLDSLDLERDIRQIADDETDPSRQRKIGLIADRVRLVGERFRGGAQLLANPWRRRSTGM